MILIFLFLNTTITAIFLILIIYYLWFRQPVPRISPRGRVYPADETISVIVPMRNEEANVSKCLKSLLALNYPHLEIIAVDDSSTDGTYKKLKRVTEVDKRLKVIRICDLPPNWMGQTYAMSCGAKDCTSDWILFTDADATQDPRTIRVALSFAKEHQIDMLSLGAHHKLLSIWEKLLMPVAAEAAFYLFLTQNPNNKDSERAIAFGQFILIRRRVFNAVGGFEAIKSSHIVDLDFARLIKKMGYKSITADGTEFVRVKMYGNLSGIWNAWSRRMYYTVSQNPLSVWMCALLPVIGIIPFVMFLISLFFIVAYGADFITGASFLLSAGHIVLISAYRWLLVDPLLRIPKAYVILHPLGCLLLEIVLINSVWRALMKKQNTWKGRQYR